MDWNFWGRELTVGCAVVVSPLPREWSCLYRRDQGGISFLIVRSFFGNIFDRLGPCIGEKWVPRLRPAGFGTHQIEPGDEPRGPSRERCVRGDRWYPGSLRRKRSILIVAGWKLAKIALRRSRRGGGRCAWVVS